MTQSGHRVASHRIILLTIGESKGGSNMQSTWRRAARAQLIGFRGWDR